MSELTVPVLGSEASSFMFWLCSSGPAPGLGGDGAGSASAGRAPTSADSRTSRSTTKRETLVMNPPFRQFRRMSLPYAQKRSSLFTRQAEVASVTAHDPTTSIHERGYRRAVTPMTGTLGAVRPRQGWLCTWGQPADDREDDLQGLASGALTGYRPAWPLSLMQFSSTAAKR